MKTLVLAASPLPPLGNGLAIAELFAEQENARVGLFSRPYLQWQNQAGRTGAWITKRIQRLCKEVAPLLVDISPAYLPHACKFLEEDQKVKFLYLGCTVESAIEHFEEFLSRQSMSYNYWAMEESAEWQIDPDFGRIFPTFHGDMSIREAIKRYCDICGSLAETAASQFPERVFTTSLVDFRNTETVRDLLTWCNLPSTRHVVHTHPDDISELFDEDGLAVRRERPRSKCVVLVPFQEYISPGTENCLRELELHGYEVWRRGGISAIDQGRSQLATDAILAGFEELMWVDSDVEFDVAAVDKLRSHELPVVGGIYAKKGVRSLASKFLPRTESVVFGQKGGLVEVEYLATGFVLVRRSVFVEMIEKLPLAPCNELFGKVVFPFFLPQIVPQEDASWYVGEDYSFFHHVRELGFRVYADTSIRLWHVGSYRYGWEDAGSPARRFGNYTYMLSNRANATGSQNPAGDDSRISE